MKPPLKLVLVIFKCTYRTLILARSTLSKNPILPLILSPLGALLRKIKPTVVKIKSSMRTGISYALALAPTSKSVKTLLNLRIACVKWLLTLHLYKVCASLKLG